MKVKVTADARKWLTLEQAPIVNEIVRWMKEDTFTAKDYAEMACRGIFGACAKVYEADAEIAGNSRIADAYGPNTGKLDVWVNYTAQVDGHLMVQGGSYVTDIWNLDGEQSPKDVLTANSFILKFERSR